MALGSTSIVAVSRETLRNQMITSIFGRRSGLDVAGYQIGEADIRLPIDNISTTAATSMISGGFSVMSATPNSSCIYSLLQPVLGIYKQITQISTPAVGNVVQFGANAQLVTTAGTSFNQITFTGVGSGINMMCISTSTAAGPIWVTDGYLGAVFSTY